MKIVKYFAAISFTLISIFSLAQAKTDGTTSEKIKVWGNCGMCKSHIEKAAKQAGASYAVWNKDTKILAVTFDASKTNNQQIQQQVANAGYDTKDFTANDKAYKALDECCQYDRKAAAKDTKQKQ